MFKVLALSFALALPTLAQSPSRPAITGISHLTLFADNIPKSQKFYRDLLGWDQIPATGANSGIRFYANHAQYVELVTPLKPNLADRLDSVAFTTADAETLRKYLAEKGVSVPKAVTLEKNGDRTFEVRDPEDNKVQFTQPGSHPPAQPKNVSESLSTHIMHAGYEVHN